MIQKQFNRAKRNRLHSHVKLFYRIVSYRIVVGFRPVALCRPPTWPHTVTRRIGLMGHIVILSWPTVWSRTQALKWAPNFGQLLLAIS